MTRHHRLPSSNLHRHHQRRRRIEHITHSHRRNLPILNQRSRANHRQELTSSKFLRTRSTEFRHRENAQRFERLSRGKPSRSRCCCCLCWFLSFLAAFLFLLGLAAAILYLVFRPESPDYSIERVSISGFNLTSSGPISPAFNVTVRANNPNNKIGIYYEKGSSVNVYSDGVKMATGSLPVFYQDKNNVTVVVTSLKGTGIELTSGVRTALATGVSKGTVPFNLALRAPVKLKLGSVKTWKITVKVDCELTVDKLTASARIGSKSCDYGVDLW
ncbi:LATE EMBRYOGENESIS ABUNDANT (LEA) HYDROXYPROLINE-RICH GLYCOPROTEIN FAMILY [Salix koriyanagi]|uniref:LATE EMBRYOGENESIS ABUNDANT (LEA) HYDROXYPROLINE-RICH GLYCOPROTEIN FAMILY n=1 Tax=Salix koriyanagi TaxID=2511006 RepID=A0A9Q0TSS9_9ROSI|nr:LATE EMBRYOGENESIS ABUNDANT (LEA) HYDROXYPROLINE-RICH GLYCOPROTEIN FAMILY [Salix koriyanagi]